jgi:hypothetical protein
MKKRLEADLISIAHRILQLKNKSDINQLYVETQKLYEKLAVLRFIDDNFGETKPTIGLAEMETEVEQIFDKKEAALSETPIETLINTEVQPEIAIDNSAELDKIKDQENIENPIIIEEEEIQPAFELNEIEDVAVAENPEITEVETVEENIKPAFELNGVEPIVNEIEPLEETTPFMNEIESASIPEIQIETSKKPEAVQISFEDILGANYHETQFVKASQFEKKSDSSPVNTEVSFDFKKEHSNTHHAVLEKEEPKSVTLNEKLAKGITIGLNDRIAFVKHLFGGNNEDYNRVLNQLITLDTFQETKSFIDEMVKPDYNNWDGKEDYEHRFMEIIEKKFLSF